MATTSSRRTTRRAWAKRTPAAIVIIASLVMSALAIIHQGVSTAQVDVNDGGIWVTNESRRLVGHLNYDSRTLDAALRTQTSDFDISQSADTVTFSDLTTRSIVPVDVAGVRLGAATSLTERSTAVQGGQRLGVLDDGEGFLWVASAQAPSQTPFTEAGAITTGLIGGVVTAAQDGTVLAASAQGGRVVMVSAEGNIDRIKSTPLEGVRADANLSITAVGNRPVALDANSNTLFLPTGKALQLSDLGVPTGAILQDPGPDAADVLIATSEALISVPLDGSAITTIAANAEGITGRPAKPVRHQGCSYAAWAGSGSYLRDCSGQANDEQFTVDTLTGAGSIKFRTNRTRIVLNDIGSGSVWLPDQNMVLMADWDQIDSELQADELQDESPQVTEQISDPERKERNTPPVAVDDEFGIRPGRTTTLPVLQNDSDADGDVLTARAITESSIGTIERTRGGQALQITDVPEDAEGSTSFTYEASDGQAAGTATVRLSVHPWTQNSGPVHLRDPLVKLGSGAEISYNVLPDWIDPDGDPIFLQSVSAPDGLQVQFREEGTVTVRDLGVEPGLKAITVIVSDGRAQTTGTLSISLQSPGNLPPVANADFYVARMGEPTIIHPLSNDTDPNGDSLSLVAVSVAPAGTTLVPDLELGTMTFTARATGTYQFTYTVTDGPSTALGVVRVDVVEVDQQAVPVAEDDLVVLPAGGSALAAPLNNDSDPAGGVLVVQRIEVPDHLGLDVTLVDRHLLRITAPRGLDQAVSFPYWVSNGSQTAVAIVTVVPTAAQDDKQPPLLQPDRAKARVGDIASVSVLANDRSPAGLTMQVLPHLEFTPNPDVGRPFVTGNLVRLEAGDTPGVIHVAYSVRDSVGNLATSTVMFQVLPLDGANAAPQPKSLTAWAVSGQTARVPVPLNGIDPDGDSVTLVGIEQAPQKGTVALGVDWLEYTPAKNTTGTDVFTYIVEDRQGKQASARVRVGIAPPADINQPPTAVKDTILVRPDRRLSIDILANDIDPDGDAVSLVPDSLVSAQGDLGQRIAGTVIQVNSPSEPGSYLFTYKITDGRGGMADGTLTLNVSLDAPLQAPIARDDVVPITDVRTDGTPVTVDVLANDADPDGDVADLVVTTEAPGVTLSNRSLVIVPEERRRMVVYTITDVDGLSASAVVSVPGTDQARPRLDSTRVPIEVRAGEDVTLDIGSYVITRTGRSPMITDANSLKASVGVDPGITLVDSRRISFHVTADYSGKSSVSFEVRDGPAEDTSALSAVLSIPLNVKATVNQPPSFVPSPIRVAAGEEAVSVDLAPMVTDPDGANPTRFTYSMVSAPEGLAVSLNGHTLSVRAAVDRQKGQTAPISVTVDDGSGPVGAQIPVTVVASTRPLIQVSDALVSAANAGGTEAIDLTGYTLNPFPETPVRIMGTSVQLGEGTVDPQGTTLYITPALGFHGQMTVGYRLIDATGDPDRIVEGRVRMVVRDRPEAPSNVSVTATGAGAALVSFQPGSDNGAPITHFTLRNITSGQSFTCQVASCPVTGLENGVRHSFSVTATNDAGISDSSPASTPVLVDMRPERPAPPTGTVGDGTITVNWTPPINEGSALVSYTLYVTGPSPQTIELPPSQTSMTLTGLVNGQAYRFSIQATNRAESPSDPSEASVALIPFGVPPAPLAVSVDNLPDVGDGLAHIQVNWQPSASTNGRPIDMIRVTVGTQVEEFAGDSLTLSHQMSVPAGQDSVAMVSVHTEGGWSAPAAATFDAVTSPVAIDPPTVIATGQDRQVSVTGLSPKAGNGYRLSRLRTQVSIDGAEFLDFNGGTISGTNGQVMTLVFRQVASWGASAIGPSTAPITVTPYGPPLPATVSATPTTDGQGVTFTWDAPPSNGGPHVTGVQLIVNGQGVTINNALTGTYTATGNPGDVMEAYVISTDSAGTSTTSGTARARVWGTVAARPASCRGGELPVLANPGGPCLTFDLAADRWQWDQFPLTCSFISDVDGVTYETILWDNRWARSGMRTLTSDAQAMQSWPGTLLRCRPGG